MPRGAYFQLTSTQNVSLEMLPIPPDQTSPLAAGLPKHRKGSASTSAPTVPRRQGDRDGGDDDDGDGDDAAARRLPVYVRFRHLVEHGIVASWQSLLRLIDEDGFPEGTMLGRNTRAWTVDEVQEWLANRPSARKIVPPKKPRQQQQDDIEGPNPQL
jgi:predicted DNA-binding transcriptional regulator AlpA